MDDIEKEEGKGPEELASQEPAAPGAVLENGSERDKPATNANGKLFKGGKAKLALALANVTLTLLKPKKLPGLRFIAAKLSFGNGALTYPTGGIPLPLPNKFGLNANQLYAYILQDAPDGYVRKLNVTYGADGLTVTAMTLQIFVSAGLTPAGVITNGAPDTFAGTPVAAGPLVELANTVAPAATVVRLTVMGK